jgi:hypothetical protein
MTNIEKLNPIKETSTAHLQYEGWGSVRFDSSDDVARFYFIIIASFKDLK